MDKSYCASIVSNEKGAFGSVGFAMLAPVLLLSVGLMYDLGELLVARAQVQIAIDATNLGVATFHRFEPQWDANFAGTSNSIVEKMMETQFKYNISLNSIANSIDPATGYVCQEEANNEAFIYTTVNGVKTYRIKCTFNRVNRFMNTFNLITR